MKKLTLEIILKILVILITIAFVIGIFSKPQSSSGKDVPDPPLPILTSIAPRYTLYLNPGDAQSLDKWNSVDYVRMQKSSTQFTLKSHIEDVGGIWTSTVIVDPQTLTGTIQEEYNGTIECGVVKLEPNQFGGFNFIGTYPGESKPRNAVLKPQWWE